MTGQWPGSYGLGFQVVEGSTWLGNYGTKSTTVQAVTSYVGNSIPDTMFSPIPRNVAITFKNTGATAWTSSNGFELVIYGQTWAFNMNNTVTAYGVPAFAIPSGVTVNPGDSYTWNVQMTPQWAGNYGLGFQVVDVNHNVWVPGNGEKDITVNTAPVP